MPLGEHIVKSFVYVIQDPENHKFYFDSFFSSCLLMTDLSKSNIHAIGNAVYGQIKQKNVL